jgi:ADP-ribose pyrophosphatase YjhB (NUDIX family)
MGLLVLAALLLVAVALATQATRGQRPGRRKWTSAGGVVVDGRGRVALVRQRDRKGRWRWTLPKGRIEPGETPEQAALREVHEESGLRARIVRPLTMHEGRLHFTCYFEMALVRNDGVHDGETRQVVLVPLAEAAHLLRSRRDLRVLRRLVERGTQVAAAVPARG